jgi:hypothetical protein
LGAFKLLVEEPCFKHLKWLFGLSGAKGWRDGAGILSAGLAGAIAGSKWDLYVERKPIYWAFAHILIERTGRWPQVNSIAAQKLARRELLRLC